MYISDVNECLTNNGGCSQNCTNANGSYFCSCRAGYELSKDEYSCTGKGCMWCLYFKSPVLLDINECLRNNGGCSQNCTNSNGSYLCSCKSGYYLAQNQYSCTGNNCMWYMRSI